VNIRRTHVVASGILTAGFLMGRSAAWALDLATPPPSVTATTTVGLQPEPAEGEGTREEALDDDPPAEGRAPLATDDADAEPDTDEDGATEPSPAVTPVNRAGFRVSAELKGALDALAQRDGQMWAHRGSAPLATTLSPALQAAADNILKDYEVPAGAVVMMDPRSGRVLAMAGHTQDGSFGRELAVVPLAPAASVFKMVTASALLERGVGPQEQVCYAGGGRHRLREKDLKRVATTGTGRCVTLEQAMAFSANVPFAHLTRTHLAAADLQKWAGAFMFNRALPLGAPASPAHIPTEGLAFAQTGAGFGDVRLSALHGALLANTVANGGVMVDPVLFADQRAGTRRRVMAAQHAHALGAMMERTVTEGTARKAFRERRRNALGDIRAAGKTGSLAEQGPFRDYSWFVGYAPADNPTVVVSTFIMNDSKWRIRAAYVGREMLRTALVDGHKPYRPLAEVAQHR
jgi:peptidoglycan glycosyltransferase